MTQTASKGPGDYDDARDHLNLCFLTYVRRPLSPDTAKSMSALSNGNIAIGADNKGIMKCRLTPGGIN